MLGTFIKKTNITLKIKINAIFIAAMVLLPEALFAAQTEAVKWTAKQRLDTLFLSSLAIIIPILIYTYQHYRQHTDRESRIRLWVLPLSFAVFYLLGYAILYGEPLLSYRGASFFAWRTPGIPDKIHQIIIDLFQSSQALLFVFIIVKLLSNQIQKRWVYMGVIVSVLLVNYTMLVHWMWSPYGFLKSMYMIDFAGAVLFGILVGTAYLAFSLLIKFPKEIPSLGSGLNRTFNIALAGIIMIGVLSGNAIMAQQETHIVSMIIGVGIVILSGIGLSQLFNRYLNKILTVSLERGIIIALIAYLSIAPYIELWLIPLLTMLALVAHKLVSVFLRNAEIPNNHDLVSMFLGTGMWSIISLGFVHDKYGLLFGGGGMQLMYQFLGISLTVSYVLIVTMIILRLFKVDQA